jgi:hypothetical protein
MDSHRNKHIIEVIYSKGLFYALYAFGSVETLDISENCPKLNMVSTNCYSTASFSEEEVHCGIVVATACGDKRVQGFQATSFGWGEKVGSNKRP